MANEPEDKDSYRRRNSEFYSRWIPGVWLIVIGGIFLLNSFGIVPNDTWGKIWPIFIILPGLFILFRPRR